MPEKVYVVTMFRWGVYNQHSYIRGVYSTEEKAREAGEEEYVYRGCGKYYPRIEEVPLDSDRERERVVVLELPPTHAPRRRWDGE